MDLDSELISKKRYTYRVSHFTVQQIPSPPCGYVFCFKCMTTWCNIRQACRVFQKIFSTLKHSTPSGYQVITPTPVNPVQNGIFCYSRSQNFSNTNGHGYVILPQVGNCSRWFKTGEYATNNSITKCFTEGKLLCNRNF